MRWRFDGKSNFSSYSWIGRERERYEKERITQQAKHLYDWALKSQHEQEIFKERKHRKAHGLCEFMSS
eukprot:2056193-Amphidinium_carterae.4